MKLSCACPCAVLRLPGKTHYKCTPTYSNHTCCIKLLCSPFDRHSDDFQEWKIILSALKLLRLPHKVASVIFMVCFELGEAFAPKTIVSLNPFRGKCDPTWFMGSCFPRAFARSIKTKKSLDLGLANNGLGARPSLESRELLPGDVGDLVSKFDLVSPIISLQASTMMVTILAWDNVT